MTDSDKIKDLKSKGFNNFDSSSNNEENTQDLPKKGPLSFFTGALTSILLAFLSFQLSKNVVIYFTIHNINYSSPIAQSVASGFKTLVIGMSFLATFTFGFIGLGLTIVFIRSLLGVKDQEAE